MRFSRAIGGCALAGLLVVASSSSQADDATVKPQAVSLTAVVVPGAPPLRDAAFTVTRVGTGLAEAIVAKSGKGAAQLQLPSGRYRVVASYGHSKVEDEILVDGAPINREINLNAGTIHLKLIKHVGGPTFRQGVAWEILTYGRDAQGKRHLIASSKESQPRFVLRDGYYLARATVGTRQVRHTIEVSAGITYNYSVILQ